MKKPIVLVTFLLLTMTWACDSHTNQTASTSSQSVAKKNGTVNWADSALKCYGKLAYYYNNNIHDTLEMMLPEVLDLCRDHELWTDYYDTWMLLDEDYIFSGEISKAVKVAQEIHDDAAKRDNKYGLTVAEFLKGLAYDVQKSTEESMRSFERALYSYPSDAKPFLKNTIYVYYTSEMKHQDDTLKMRNKLDEWNAYIEQCRRDTTIPPRQFDNWLYYYHHACYIYSKKVKDFDNAERHIDSIVYHISNTGWSQVTRNEVAGYRTQMAIERGKYEEALRLNNQQIPLAKDLDINAYAEILSQRAVILSKLGQWKEAYHYLTTHYDLVDSLTQAETRQQLNEMNKRFEVDELKMQAEREHMASERQRMYMLFFVGAIVIIAVVTTIILRLRATRRLAEVKAEQERLESELRIARNIQMSMVPANFPCREGLDMYASMTPAREVGGDLYGYVLADDHLYFCVGDVSGKGVPASLVMAQAIRLFQTLAKQGMMPADICTNMNQALSGDDNNNGMFVTFFLGLIDLKSGHLSFCNAGHNPPVIGGDDSHGSFLKMESNAPLGLWPELEYVGEEIDTIKGRPLFVYSDGLNEAENAQQVQFGDDRLLDILRNTYYESSKQVIETLTAAIEKHRDGADPNDDLTMMCIRVDDSLQWP
jgi:serine phosphatase RsbU (regulator of sigma subunit)